jgi:hypothetical protein
MPRFFDFSPTDDELLSLNRCRLFSQVLFLSEICTGDGLAISEDAWRGTRFEVPSKTLSWPRQQRPSSKDWRIWQGFLKKSFLFRGLRLHSPLGAWLRAGEGWEWFYSPSHECLFKFDSKDWTAFSQIHRRDKLPTFTSVGVVSHPPKDLCRASIYFNKKRIVCTGFSPIRHISQAQPTSLFQHLQLAEKGEKWCFSHFDMQDEGSILAQAIQEGEAIAISDGSFHDQYGTAAWVLEGCVSTGRAIGAVVVPGTAKDQSAYRSELAGIFSILVFAKKMCEFFRSHLGP